MKKLIVVLSILAIAAVAHADLLAAWEMTGANAVTMPVLTNVFSAVGITSNSTVLRLGAGVTPDSGTANTFAGSSFGEVSLANAISVSDYFSWTVQADPGGSISVTNIAWKFQRTGTGGSNYVLRSSFDGFVTDLYSSNNFLAAAGSGDANFPLSSLSGSNSLEFRLYVWSASSDATGVDRFRTTGGTDLTIQGTVIPEPGTMALMGLGLLGLTYLRRKIG
jgi:hypothetical protein